MDHNTNRKIKEALLARKEPQWLHKLRLESLAIYAKYENSSRTYADLYPVGKRLYDLLTAEINIPYERVEPYFVSDLKSKGVIFTAIGSAAREHSELLQRYLGASCELTHNPLMALNDIIFTFGSFLYVPPGVAIEYPLQSFFYRFKERGPRFERQVIVVDRGATIDFVDGCAGGQTTGHDFKASVSEIVALEGAKINYQSLQNWQGTRANLGTKNLVLYKDAGIKWILGEFNPHYLANYPTVTLRGEGAKIDIKALYYYGLNQKDCSSGIQINHATTGSISRLLTKIIAAAPVEITHRNRINIANHSEPQEAAVIQKGLLLDPLSMVGFLPADNDRVAASVAYETDITRATAPKPMASPYSPLDPSTNTQAMDFSADIINELPLEYQVELKALLAEKTES